MASFDIILSHAIKKDFNFHGIFLYKIPHSIDLLTDFLVRQFSIFFRFHSLFTTNIDATTLKKYWLKLEFE